MPSYTIHFPDTIYEEITKRAKKQGKSRSKVAIELIEKALEMEKVEEKVQWDASS